MTLVFYPQDDELDSARLDEQLEIMLASAERFRAAILDTSVRYGGVSTSGKVGSVPREMPLSFNWEYLARGMREVREMPESSPAARLVKATHLEKLAGIYEVLRGARMPKLEAVRLALTNELMQLRAIK